MSLIIGNLEQRENLNKIIETQQIGHAYMFVGPKGIGKSLIAKDFAKSILCLNPTNHYCDHCECCRIFENSPDFVWITNQDDVIKVGEIRDLSENIMLKPVKSNRRVFVIDDADTMNEAAQNALLKILEEPPTYATIILVVSNQEKIVRTIKSRCAEIHFVPLTLEEMQTYYKDIEMDEELYQYAKGSIGKLEKIRASQYMDQVIEFEKALSYKDLLEMNKAFNQLKEKKNVKENINDILDLLMIKLNAELKENYSQKIAQMEII